MSQVLTTTYQHVDAHLPLAHVYALAPHPQYLPCLLILLLQMSLEMTAIQSLRHTLERAQRRRQYFPIHPQSSLRPSSPVRFPLPFLILIPRRQRAPYKRKVQVRCLIG